MSTFVSILLEYGGKVLASTLAMNVSVRESLESSRRPSRIVRLTNRPPSVTQPKTPRRTAHLAGVSASPVSVSIGPSMGDEDGNDEEDGTNKSSTVLATVPTIVVEISLGMRGFVREGGL